MRRQLAIAALCAAVFSAPLQAQMHGGGSRGGMSGGRSGFSSAGTAGFRSGSSVGAVSRGGFGRGSVGFNGGFHQPFIRSSRSFVGFRRPFFGPPFSGRRVFFRTFSPFSPFYFGYYGYPFYGGGYGYSSASYYPGYDYDSSSYSVQNDVARQQQDIDRLEDEVARLREQRESRDAASRTSDRKSEPVTPTLLVFLDKHTQEVENYAIVGGTLWVFTALKATKLPLAWLDVEATAKANDERGVNFQVPR